MIDSNLGPILHRFWDMATYSLKHSIFHSAFWPFKVGHPRSSIWMSLESQYAISYW